MDAVTLENGRVEVALKWDPSEVGRPPVHLDIVTATYTADAPYGEPAYIVHVDSRAPDGTIYLHRGSRDGKGLGWDEVMMLELDRLAERYVRVVTGVVIRQHYGRWTFGAVRGLGLRVREGYVVLAEDDFGGMPGATAARVGEFVRTRSGQPSAAGDGEWAFRPGIEGYDLDPADFTRKMGEPHEA